MAKKRDYTLNPPQTLNELNKESMLSFVKQLGKEDSKWFAQLCIDNRIEKKYTFDSKNGTFKKGDTYKGYDLPVIRKAFAKKYFPVLVAPKPSKAKKSFDDELEDLLK